MLKKKIKAGSKFSNFFNPFLTLVKKPKALNLKPLKIKERKNKKL